MEKYTIIINIVISIIVAIITAKLSLNGFYKKEIWLRKEKQYTEIISGLSKLQNYYGKLFDFNIHIIDNNPINEDYDTEIGKLLRDLEAISTTPCFILKKEVHLILKELFKSANNRIDDESNGDLVSYFNRMYGEIKDTNKKISELARKDLKIRN